MDEHLNVFELHLKRIYDYTNSHDEYSDFLNSALKEVRRKQMIVKKEVLETYREDLSDLDHKRIKATEAFKKHKKLVKRVISFNANDLGLILEKLVSLTEGTLFVYQNTKAVRIKNNILQNIRVHVIGDIEFIKPEYLDIEELKKLEDTGKILILKEEERLEKTDDTVQLYDINHMGISKKRFNPKFSYIDDFLDYVINYRYHNELLFITYDDLEYFLEEFLNSRIKESVKDPREEELERLKILRRELEEKNNKTR